MCLVEKRLGRGPPALSVCVHPAHISWAAGVRQIERHLKPAAARPKRARVTHGPWRRARRGVVGLGGGARVARPIDPCGSASRWLSVQTPLCLGQRWSIRKRPRTPKGSHRTHIEPDDHDVLGNAEVQINAKFVHDPERHEVVRAEHGARPAALGEQGEGRRSTANWSSIGDSGRAAFQNVIGRLLTSKTTSFTISSPRRPC